MGPKAVAALAILVIAYFVGKALSWAISYGIDRTSFGKRSIENGQPLGDVIGRGAFWVVLLVSLPAALGAWV